LRASRLGIENCSTLWYDPIVRKEGATRCRSFTGGQHARAGTAGVQRYRLDVLKVSCYCVSAIVVVVVISWSSSLRPLSLDGFTCKKSML
jgi:hypothetical protein